MLNFMAAFDHRYATRVRPRTPADVAMMRGEPITAASLTPCRTHLSQHRAKIASMNGDVITAGLWALAGFDPALVHVAELREHFRHLPEEDQIRTAIDRLISVYVEGQCHELMRGAGITTPEASYHICQLPGLDEVTQKAVSCTSDPLILEICGYAKYLGTLTAHGTAPWNRFAAVVNDCHAQLTATL